MPGVVVVALLAALVIPRSDAARVRDAAGCPHSGDMPEPASIAVTRGAVLCLLNQERAQHGLTALRMNLVLETASQQHSDDMALRQFFSHETPDGVKAEQRMIAAGYPSEGVWVGENLWFGSGPEATPVRAMKGWMESPGHRATILRAEFTEVGVGVAYEAPRDVDGRRAATYTTDFGGPGVR